MSKMTFELYIEQTGASLNPSQFRLAKKYWEAGQQAIFEDLKDGSYSEGCLGDGAAILYNGEMLKVGEIVEHLNTNLAYAELRREQMNESDERLTRALVEVQRLERELERHREVTTSHNVLVKQMDDLLNGIENAASNPSLCDIVSQVADHVRKINGPLLGETPYGLILKELYKLRDGQLAVCTNLDFNANKIITQMRIHVNSTVEMQTKQVVDQVGQIVRKNTANIPGPR